jgi:phosphoglycolate phosphatase
MHIRAILFDKDGTLLDFDASWSAAYRELALDLAAGDPEAAATFLAMGGLDPASGRFRPGSVLAAGTTLDIVALWFPTLRDEAFTTKVAEMDRIFHANGIRCSVPVAGLAETLDALAALGMAMGVATNDGTAAAKAALAAIGVGARLPHVFGYDSVARPKPAPDIVDAFAKLVGVSPAEVAVVGDNPHDLAMARSGGAGAAIGVLSGNSGADDLAPLADVVLPSIRELPAWLQNRK